MKLVLLGLLVFCAAFTYGFATTPAIAQAAGGGGGGGFCWYQCGCNGVPMYCCYTNGHTACKDAPWAPIGCPQIADC
jgi:hypothetical protein